MYYLLIFFCVFLLLTLIKRHRLFFALCPNTTGKLSGSVCQNGFSKIKKYIYIKKNKTIEQQALLHLVEFKRKCPYRIYRGAYSSVYYIHLRNGGNYYMVGIIQQIYPLLSMTSDIHQCNSHPLYTLHLKLFFIFFIFPLYWWAETDAIRMLRHLSERMRITHCIIKIVLF